MEQLRNVRIALVHEFLGSTRGGQEEVLRELHALFPEAPVYTIIADKVHLPDEYRQWDIRPTFLERLPFGASHFQWYLPLMPSAVESIDLSEFDLVLSSASAFAKGVLTQPHTLHICYCHTPTRYLWTDAHSYIVNRRFPLFVRAFVQPYLTKLRLWDRLAAERPHFMVANSHAVAARIRRYYQRDSTVIYPPVDTGAFYPGEGKGGYFLTGGRLVESKRFDLVIHAFNHLRMKLVIFGCGREERRLRALAGPTISFTGYLSREARAKVFANARAFIYPQVEDFGITAVESMAAGRPVIAYAAGGILETVKEGVTGVYFTEATWECLAEAVVRFPQDSFDPHYLRVHAEAFSTARFRDEISRYITHAWKTYREQFHLP
ncbi:MAG: glycosyltransferase [Patescibacteria group bacterium]